MVGWGRLAWGGPALSEVLLSLESGQQGHPSKLMAASDVPTCPLKGSWQRPLLK